MIMAIVGRKIVLPIGLESNIPVIVIAIDLEAGLIGNQGFLTSNILRRSEIVLHMISPSLTRVKIFPTVTFKDVMPLVPITAIAPVIVRGARFLLE